METKWNRHATVCLRLSCKMQDAFEANKKENCQQNTFFIIVPYLWLLHSCMDASTHARNHTQPNSISTETRRKSELLHKYFVFKSAYMYILTLSTSPLPLQTIMATSTFLSVVLCPLLNSPFIRVIYMSFLTSPDTTKPWKSHLKKYS